MTRKKEWFNMSHAEITDLIDPNLKFIRDFKSNTWGYFSDGVYLVKNGEDLFVLKLEFCLRDELINEKKILKILIGIKGIPKLYDIYIHDSEKRNERYVALLKEYIPGETYKEVYRGHSIIPTKKVQKNIEELVSNIHNHNILIKDFHSGNVIINKNQSFLVDFGFAEQCTYPKELRIEYRSIKKDFFPDIK